MRLKMSAKFRPFCFGLSVLIFVSSVDLGTARMLNAGVYAYFVS